MQTNNTTSTFPVVDEYGFNEDSEIEFRLNQLERDDRLAQKDKLIPYGISFLDENFDGIAPDDLIVFGAKTGAGKSQLALQIAINAAKLGKQVLFFALESTRYELSRRLKFARLYPELKKKYGYVRYGSWSRGLIEEDSLLEPEEWEKNIRLVFRLNDFDLQKLERHILAHQITTDLIIIDHLHYLDLEGENENREIKTAVKTIRSLVIDIKKPIVLISHLRKTDKFDSTPWPKIDDFHGSSEISKMATQAFSLCQMPVTVKKRDQSIYGGKKYPEMMVEIEEKGTVFTILKNRTDGVTVGTQALLEFDYQMRCYSKRYTLLEWNRQEKKLKESDQKKEWCLSADNGWDK